MKNSTFPITLALCLALSQISSADEWEGFHGRCKQDHLNNEKAIGRNTWAMNCGFITQHDFDIFMSTPTLRYISFTQNAPTDPQTPCGPYQKLSVCEEDCFTPSQRIWFGDDYLAIADGKKAQKSKITTLAEEASMGHLIFTQEDIQFFIEGEERSKVIVIKGANGHTLQVTPNHPMFDETGNLRRADSVKIGDSLLTAEGSTQVIDSQMQTYNGPVLNVSPVKSEARANTNIAEGFITGSARFQGEWANENFRFLLRSSIDTSSL